ncbi:class II aldolase/adducin domain protein [Histoplasma ohiense]|nr:class II aldolase/adducin domain protein [Histoplasma ohiense (nom. inval.)]
MADAFRMFSKLGFADGASGHISLRDPVNPNYFWISNAPLFHFFSIERHYNCIYVLRSQDETIFAPKPRPCTREGNPILTFCPLPIINPIIDPYAKHFARITVSDLILVNHEGTPLTSTENKVNMAGFIIHLSIHQAHPDLNAVCHMHSPYGRSGQPLARALKC